MNSSQDILQLDEVVVTILPFYQLFISSGIISFIQFALTMVEPRLSFLMDFSSEITKVVRFASTAKFSEFSTMFSNFVFATGIRTILSARLLRLGLCCGVSMLDRVGFGGALKSPVSSKNSYPSTRTRFPAFLHTSLAPIIDHRYHSVSFRECIPVEKHPNISITMKSTDNVTLL